MGASAKVGARKTFLAFIFFLFFFLMRLYITFRSIPPEILSQACEADKD